MIGWEKIEHKGISC